MKEMFKSFMEPHRRPEQHATVSPCWRVLKAPREVQGLFRGRFMHIRPPLDRFPYLIFTYEKTTPTNILVIAVADIVSLARDPPVGHNGYLHNAGNRLAHRARRPSDVMITHLSPVEEESNYRVVISTPADETLGSRKHEKERKKRCVTS